jgi:hypothetical protein
MQTSAVSHQRPATTSAAAVSVVIVSDYAADPQTAGEDLRRTLRALRNQSHRADIEFLLVDTPEGLEALPDAAMSELPGVRLVAAPVPSAEGLKNAGVAQSRGEMVIVLDADCEPAPGWLSAAIAALTTDDRYAAVSGKTLYRQQNLVARLCGLFTRGYLDPGASSEEALSLSGNNAAYRRAALLRCPFPEDAGPFAGRIHAQRFRDAGMAARFCPEMLVFHAYDGWAIERDIRRHLGRSCIHSRLVEPALPFARAARWGALSIPFFLAARTVYDWRLCWRVHSRYGVRTREVPVAMAFALALRALELPGMLDAVLNRPVPRTHYR